MHFFGVNRALVRFCMVGRLPPADFRRLLSTRQLRPERKSRETPPILPPTDFFLVKAMSAGPSIDLDGLVTSLSRNSSMALDRVSDTLLRVLLSTADGSPGITKSEIFVLRNGTYVVWNSGGSTSIDSVIEIIGKHSTVDRALPVTEDIRCSYWGSTISLQNNQVMVPHPGPHLPGGMTKLAVSLPLANSVKLDMMEQEMDILISRLKSIPKMLVAPCARREMRTKILPILYKTMHLRGELNLHSHLLGTPDMFWENEQLEEIYEKSSTFLDIPSRLAILNTKIDYSKEMAELLKSHLDSIHSARIEYAIVFLIAVEVAFALIKSL